MTTELKAPEFRQRLDKLDGSIGRCTKSAWFFVVLGFIAVGAWFASLHWAKQDGQFSIANLSLLGSYLQGAVASLWSLAGLLFIYVAFLGQKQQLLYQQEDLATTRAELEEQKKQLTAQNRSINKQNFENTFFQLLNLQNQIVNGMRDYTDRKEFEGRQCFGLWWGAFRVKFQQDIDNSINHGRENSSSILNEAFAVKSYEDFFSKYQDELGHYFRTLYHIIKFVKTSDVEDKRRYTSLVRAQLSCFELLFLFYNGLSSYGREKFKPLIEEFGMLENMNTDLLLLPKHKELYPPKAFE